MNEVICPRCKKPAVGWPTLRPDTCTGKKWANCIRNPEDVLRIEALALARLEAEAAENQGVPRSQLWQHVADVCADHEEG